LRKPRGIYWRKLARVLITDVFCIVAGGTRISSGVSGAEFSFTLEEAEDWLDKHGKAAQ